jgi:hypothetical protein
MPRGGVTNLVRLRDGVTLEAAAEEVSAILCAYRGAGRCRITGDISLFSDMQLIGECYKPDRVPADRRSLYDGPRRCRASVRDARRAAGRADALGNLSDADRQAR